MINKKLFSFKADLSEVQIPNRLNNPFGSIVPIVARIAAEEFQEYIRAEIGNSEYDFKTRKGKMFGVLVVETAEHDYKYLGAVSGRLSRHREYERLVPSVFDDSSDDFFINRDMTAVTKLGTQIKEADDPLVIASLKEERRLKSIATQKKLFEHYHFINLSRLEANLLDIFKRASIDKPPSAAGECAAPKLLQYAFKNNLKPKAIGEFWWGRTAPEKYREQKKFYPACLDKCKPILEYMLEDTALYSKRNI